MNIRYPLVAAAVAAGGLALAQPVQVQFQKARLVEPAYPAPADTGKTPPSGEYKPPANADPDPKSLAVPEDTQKKAKELVGKLGSPQFSEREQATRDLAKMGRMALPTLQEALGTSLEPEVAMRAEGLLPKAEAEDMKARVACFLADAGGKYQHTLPGWDKFKAVAGSDAASRKLFAEMLKSAVTHQMLLAAEKSVEEANAVLNQYVTRLWNQQNFGGRGGGWGGEFGGGAPAQPAKLPDMVAALFLESQFSDTEMSIQASIPWGWGGQGAQSVVNYVSNVPDVSSAIYGNSGEYAGPIRKILAQWMETRETAQWAYSAYNFANNIYQNDRKKTFKFALRVLESKGGQNGSYNKQNILLNFANQPNARDLLPALSKCFDDSLLIWNWQSGTPGFDIQLRDYALAYAIQLTDQKPEDYGMSRNGSGTAKQFNQQSFYFKDDTPPQNGPNGGRVVRPVKPANPPAEEPKKEEPKKEEPKDKKLSQEDRRKAAVTKWNEWVKQNVGVDEKDADAEAKKKWEAWLATPPKKEEPKKEEPKKDEAKPAEKKEPLTAEQQKRLEAELEAKKAAEKKEAEKKAPDVAPAVLPKK